MINNPKIGQKVWFLEPWGQSIHSAKITALGETEVSVRNPEKYPYADIEWDDGGNSGCLLKNLYASREELQKELKKEEEKKIAEIKAKIKDAGRAVKEIAKEMLGLELQLKQRGIGFAGFLFCVEKKERRREKRKRK